MGLGKTVQTIVFLYSLYKEVGRQEGKWVWVGGAWAGGSVWAGSVWAGSGQAGSGQVGSEQAGLGK